MEIMASKMNEIGRVVPELKYFQGVGQFFDFIFISGRLMADRHSIHSLSFKVLVTCTSFRVFEIGLPISSFSCRKIKFEQMTFRTNLVVFLYVIGAGFKECEATTVRVLRSLVLNLLVENASQKKSV